MNDGLGSVDLRRRFQIEWALVALIASVLIATAVLTGWTRPVDDLLYDAAMRVAPAPADPDIMIIAIDEPSLAALGRWPWPRTLHAKLLDQLLAARPASVTLDMLLSEPGAPADDAALADAMARIDQLYLPVQFMLPGRNGRAFDRLDPAPVLSAAADRLGHANTWIDSDGMVRSVALCFAPAANIAPLPHMLADPASLATAPDCRTPRRLRFAEPASFATVSFSAVLRGEVPRPLLRDRHLLIGMTAQGLGDRYPVPVASSGNMPGVEINANVANALANDLWVDQPGRPVALLIALAPAWLLMIAFWRIKPQNASLWVIGLGLMVLAVSVAGLAFNLWIAPGPALHGLALVYPLWGWRRLQATSDYMVAELARLEREAALPIGKAPMADADVVTGQSRKLHSAISQLRDLRRFVSDTLAGLPDPALVSDVHGQIMLTNAAADRAFGADLHGQASAALLDRIADPQAADALGAYLDDPDEGHVEFAARDGRSFVLRRAPIIDANGLGQGHIDYLADITSIAAARTEREQMLQLLSHDMRGPQAAILAMVASTDQTIDRARIARHARHTLSLADNFVDMARMQERGFAPEPVIAADLASEAADSLWAMANQRSIRIDICDQSDCAFIAAERESLFRALVNLLDNAVKYSPDQAVVTVLITIGGDGGDHGGGMITISISDQGEGIDADMLPRLFERFASEGKSSGSQAGSVRGIGLGLSYVAAVIERHGGTLSAANRAGGGALFTISLPPDN